MLSTGSFRPRCVGRAIVTQPQDEFVAPREKDWIALERVLSRDRALHLFAPETISQVGALYRALCTDLMRARSAGYTPDLVAHLDGLSARAHNLFYTAPPPRLGA